MGWVMQRWSGLCRGEVGGSCRGGSCMGGVGHAGVGWVRHSVARSAEI